MKAEMIEKLRELRVSVACKYRYRKQDLSSAITSSTDFNDAIKHLMAVVELYSLNGSCQVRLDNEGRYAVNRIGCSLDDFMNEVKKILRIRWI